MASFLSMVIIGNVGRDAELAYTPQGIAVAKFTVAVTDKWGKGEDRREKTTWFRVTVWREQAETAAQYIKKGMSILVEASGIEATAYMNKNSEPAASLEVTCKRFTFLDRAPGGESNGGNWKRPPNHEKARAGGPPDDGDTIGSSSDDIPF